MTLHLLTSNLNAEKAFNEDFDSVGSLSKGELVFLTYFFSFDVFPEGARGKSCEIIQPTL